MDPGEEWMVHPELWETPEDYAAAIRDAMLYGNSYSQRGPNGLLQWIDARRISRRDPLLDDLARIDHR